MLLPNAEYKIELKKIVEQIRESASLIDIRGEGRAQFIYATNGFRSIEISQCGKGVWVEFWNKDNEMPIKELTVSNYEEAVAASLNWLNSQ